MLPLLPLAAALLATAPEAIVRYDASQVAALNLGETSNRERLWEELHLLAGLQGLVNRDQPRLLLRYLTRWDDFWFERLRAPGQWLSNRRVVTVADLDDLLTRFAWAYHGAVVYDRSVAASSNLASTVAGCDNLLPIRYNPEPGSLYQHLVGSGRLPVVVDLRGAVTDKTSAYRWQLDRYVKPGKTDPRSLAYYIDQYWLLGKDASNQSHTLLNHDFFIARRAAFFDLLPWDDEAPVDDQGQAVGADYTSLSELLLATYQANHGRMTHVGGFVPWSNKYTNWGAAGGGHDPVPTEWRYAEILSGYNAYMDADALGPCLLVNGSFYQHFPLREHYPQQHRPTEDDLLARGLLDSAGHVVPGNYLNLYVGDYDAAAWLYQMFPERYFGTERGDVPLGWALNPNLQERMAPALHYARLEAGPRDWFVSGDSGAGYLNPGGLEEPRPFSGLPSGLEAWVDHNRPYFKRWDLGIVGFVIDGFAPAMSDAGLDAYARFAPEGIVAQKIGRVGVHRGMPYTRMTYDIGGDPVEAASAVADQMQAEGWSFLTYRSILQSPIWHQRFYDALRAARPDASIKVVDPYTFMALAKRYAERRSDHTLAPWTDHTVAWPVSGLTLRRVGDGPYELVTIDGAPVIRQAISADQTKYLYFRATDRWPRNQGQRLTIQYRDSQGRIAVEFDGPSGAYTPAEGVVSQTGSGQWRTAVWDLPQAGLNHGQNAGADLRLINLGGELVVRRAELAVSTQLGGG